MQYQVMDDVCWCVLSGTLEGVSVFSAMSLELLMMLEIKVAPRSSMYEYKSVEYVPVMCCKQLVMSVSSVA